MQNKPKVLYRSIILTLSLVLTGFFFVTVIAASTAQSEVEPNDTPATANNLSIGTDLTGTIDPVGDADYFVIPGVNNLWGFIALLDTTGSSGSQTGTLTAFGSDGVTELQTDSGSWSDGSVIAWQRYVNAGNYHYIRVTETGDDAPIDPYTLRYYSIAFSEQPEVEPNDTPATGTISAKAMTGTLADGDDVDCYRMSVLSGEQILIALNADMQNDGSTTDFVLSLYNPSGGLVSTVDVGGSGGNEIILDIDAAEDGVYAYCVSSDAGAVSPTDEYLVGPLVNEYNYWSSYELSPSWLNPGPSGITIPGALMEFELKFTNTDLLAIPGRIRLRGEFDDDCLTLVDAPGAIYVTSDRAEWEMYDLPVGESFTRVLTVRANKACTKTMHQGVSMEYFSLGVGQNIGYTIIDPTLFLPVLMSAP